jgi:hypothetical protein
MTTRPIVISRGLALAALVASAVAMAGAATASAAPTLLAPAAFEASQVRSLTQVDTAMAPDGTAFVTWPSNTTPANAMVAIRPPGGSWSTQNLGAVATDDRPIPIEVAGDGTATVLLIETLESPTREALRVRDRPPGGSFGPARPISLETNQISRPALAVSANGNAVAAWLQSDDGTTWTAHARIREGGNWDRPDRTLGAAALSGEGYAGFFEGIVRAAINDAGRAAVGYAGVEGTMRPRLAVRNPNADFSAGFNLEAGAGGDVNVAVSNGGAIAAIYNTSTTGSLQQAMLRAAPAGSTSFSTSRAITPGGQLTAALGNAIVAGPDEMFHVITTHRATTAAPAFGTLSSMTVRPFGASWVVSGLTALPGAQGQNAQVRLVGNAAGDLLAAWADLSTLRPTVAFLARGSGQFQTPQMISGIEGAAPASQPAPAIDADGNALLGLVHPKAVSPIPYVVYAAGFDAAPPTLSNVLIPPTAQATFPASFSATASDVWGTPTVSWNFGDGATADGASAAHAYGTPNPYTATVTATDAVGNSTSQSGGVSVSLGDRDRDGVLSDRDCDEGNAGIRPGQRDIPGNGIDENCDGADAAWATLATTIRFDWIRTSRGLRVTALGARGIKAGDVIIVRCSGRGCKRKKATVTVKRTPKSAAVSLNTAAKGATLRSGAKLTVEVSRQDYASRITTWTVRPGKGPKQSVRCRIPGAKKTQTCA